jgi:hypothetical protein
MAKRPTVEIDEDLLKEVMAGGASRFRKTAPVADSEIEKPEQPQAVTETAKSFRKRKEPQDYENVFLARKASVRRRQTYISTHLYEKIGSFLPVIAGGLSITAYLDNIVCHHLEQYRDDINELYEKKSQKPF